MLIGIIFPTNIVIEEDDIEDDAEVEGKLVLNY